MFYAVRVNNALALLNIDPRVFKADYRTASQAIGKQSGATPQEVAIIMVSNLPIVHRIDANPIPIKKWIKKRKIDARDPNIKNALWDLGWESFIPDY